MWTSGSINPSELTDTLNGLERNGWKVIEVFTMPTIDDGIEVWYIAHKEEDKLHVAFLPQ